MDVCSHKVRGLIGHPEDGEDRVDTSCWTAWAGRRNLCREHVLCKVHISPQVGFCSCNVFC